VTGEFPHKLVSPAGFLVGGGCVADIGIVLFDFSVIVHDRVRDLACGHRGQTANSRECAKSSASKHTEESRGGVFIRHSCSTRN